MGKLVKFLSILIIIDILFIITGQLDITSTTSFVTGAILDPSGIRTTLFFTVFLGILGISALLSTGGVTTGVVAVGTNVLAFTALSVVLGGLLGDFITIFNTLKDHNVVLATIIMAPIIMLLIVTVVEWLRGKD